MTPDQVLREAAVAQGAGKLRLSVHARARMVERNVSHWDLARALRSARKAIRVAAGKWLLQGGRDRYGQELGVVLVFHAYPKVVTVF